jgi:hypothetical protein
MSDKKMARIDVKAIVKIQDKKWRYSQTWKYENGDWYRAYAEDKNIKKIKDSAVILQNSQDSQAKPSNNTSVFSQTVPKDDQREENQFKLVEVGMQWKESFAPFQHNTLCPGITFRIRNTGSTEIRDMSILVEFYKKGTKDIFDKSTKNIINFHTTPLKPSYTSEENYVQSAKGIIVEGFDFTGRVPAPAPGKAPGKASDIKANNLKIRSQVESQNKFDVKIYYKFNHADNWQLISELFGI